MKDKKQLEFNKADFLFIGYWTTYVHETKTRKKGDFYLSLFQSNYSKHIYN